MISLTAEYALRAVVWLAADPERSQTASEVAEAVDVPGGYLSKVLQGLSRAGILRSQRGLGGGFTLACTPSSLTLWDVIEAADPVRRVKSCPPVGEAPKSKLCPLHQQIENATAAAEKVLRGCKLSKLIDGAGKVQPLCGARIKSKLRAKR